MAWKSDTIPDPFVFESAVFSVGVYGNRCDPFCISGASYDRAWRRDLAFYSLFMEHPAFSRDSKSFLGLGADFGWGICGLISIGVCAIISLWFQYRGELAAASLQAE